MNSHTIEFPEASTVLSENGFPLNAVAKKCALHDRKDLARSNPYGDHVTKASMELYM
jgi:hypothetical protein